MSRPKSERGITVVIGVSHAHPPSVGTSAASAARTQARPLVRRFTTLEATGAPTAPQGARYAASERSVWRRTLAPRSMASQSLISSTRWLRRSEEHTSELQSRLHLVCRLLLEKKKKENIRT